MVKHNRDKQYYWFLASFSVLSFVALFLVSQFSIHYSVHDALYSSVVISLIGCIVIMAMEPRGFYNMYIETAIRIVERIGLRTILPYINLTSFNIAALLFHVIPVVAFYGVYYLGDPLIWMILYLVLFGPYLDKIYPIRQMQFIGLGLILILGLYVYRLLSRVSNRESFPEYDNSEIVSSLNREKSGAGFYCRIFYIFNHYLYCKIHKINFSIDSYNWIFSSENGWTDYFEDIRLQYYETDKRIDKHLHETLDDYTLKEYRDIIPEVYRYNNKTKKQIENTRNRFELTDGNYDSIFIRRGDKLGAESKFIPEQRYLDLILVKNPNCKTIFLQTDDYNCYLELKRIIDEQKLDIRIITLCDKTSVGVIVNNSEKITLNESAKTNENNKQYLSTIIDRLNDTKAVADMNGEEIYKHVIDMVVGVDIVCHSNICVLDYQSNVSRFIKLYHVRPEHVYEINTPDGDIDYDKKVNPAYGF